MVKIYRSLVDGLLVAATESYVNSFLGIVGSSRGIRDRLEDEGDEQQEDGDHNEEVEVEKVDDCDEVNIVEQKLEVKKNVEATEADTDEEDLAISDEDDDTEDAEPKMEEVVSQAWEIVNSNRPMWTRKKDKITDEEHSEFFKIASRRSRKDPAPWTHFNAEGSITFKSISIS